MLAMRRARRNLASWPLRRASLSTDWSRMLMTCGDKVTAVMRPRCIVALMTLGVSACRKTSVDAVMKPASSGTTWPYMCDMGTMARARSGRLPRPDLYQR